MFVISNIGGYSTTTLRASQWCKRNMSRMLCLYQPKIEVSDLSKARKAVTLSNRKGRLSPEEIQRGIELIDAHEGFSFPRSRADCLHGPRPCLWVRCKYNLYLDVTVNGSLKLNFPDLDPDELPFSCALDEAQQGGMTLDQIGERLNITRERVRQLEERILRKLRRVGRRGELQEMLGPHESLSFTYSYSGDDGEFPEPPL